MPLLVECKEHLQIFTSTEGAPLKMKTRLLLAAVVVPLMSACAAPARYDYVKEGASNFQRTDALSECQYQIRLNKTPSVQEAELLKLCMQGKGFRLKRVN